MLKYFKEFKRTIILALAIILWPGIILDAEDRMIITSYYPSPSGNYSQLTSNGNTYLATTSGNVGIGTTSPLSKLHVKGTQIGSFTGTSRGMLSLSGVYNVGRYTAIDFLSDTAANPTARIAAYHDDSGSHLVFGTSNDYGAGITNTAMTIDEAGRLAIGGIIDPVSQIQVHGATTLAGMRVTTTATGETIDDGVNFGYDNAYGAYVWNKEASPIVFYTNNTEKMRIQPNGIVGIGTAAPALLSMLDVAGEIHSTDTATGFFLGGGYTADNWARLTSDASTTYHDLAVGSFWAAGAQQFDLAEVTPVRKEDRLEQGDAVVIDKKQGLRVTRSTKPYDTSVYGIISSYEQAAMVIGGIGGPETAMKTKEHLPIALIGRVKAKVSAENGAISPGDLLTTSATPGYLMKCEDISICDGAVVAKALEPLEKGKKVIQVFVKLQ